MKQFDKRNVSKKSKSDFGDAQGKHQKAKQNFLNTKRSKGNKGNMRWADLDSDY